MFLCLKKYKQYVEAYVIVEPLDLQITSYHLTQHKDNEMYTG